MKYFIQLLLSLLLFSCSQSEIVEYSGQVFTYAEEPGVKKNYEFLRDVGIPVPNVDVWLKHQDEPINAVNCCWGYEPVVIESESFIGHTITDADGRYSFSAELEEEESADRTFISSSMDHIIFGSDIFAYQSNLVDIKFIGHASRDSIVIKLFIDRDHIPGSTMTQLTLTDNDRSIENSSALYSTQTILMNNVNLNYSYTINDGETKRGEFFTGDENNPTGLRIEL